MAIFHLFQSEQYERAASAAYTYLMKHPEHEPMQNNVQYYRSMPEIKPSYFRDLESKVHMVSHYDLDMTLT